MNIGWPQGIYLGLTLVGLGVALAKDGEPQKNHHFGRSLGVSVLFLTLLWWGGFFG